MPYIGDYALENRDGIYLLKAEIRNQRDKEKCGTALLLSLPRHILTPRVVHLRAKCCREELPHVRGQGQQPRVPDCDSAGMAERTYPTSKVRGGGWEEIPHALKPEAGAVGRRSNPMPEARGSGWDDQPHAVAAWAQEGLEELSHIEDQKRRR